MKILLLEIYNIINECMDHHHVLRKVKFTFSRRETNQLAEALVEKAKNLESCGNECSTNLHLGTDFNIAKSVV